MSERNGEKWSKVMLVTVFKKIGTSKDGRKFDTYCTKLRRKDGTEQYCTVHFNKSTPVPVDFPVNLIVNKDDANMSTESAVTKEGEEFTRFNLWVKAYTIGEPYRDKSLDDFAD